MKTDSNFGSSRNTLKTMKQFRVRFKLQLGEVDGAEMLNIPYLWQHRERTIPVAICLFK